MTPSSQGMATSADPPGPRLYWTSTQWAPRRHRAVSRVVAARARTGQALHTSRLLRSRRALGARAAMPEEVKRPRVSQNGKMGVR